MAEGQTATNPQTGERVVLRGGQWVPLNAAAPARQPSPRASARYQGPMPTSADEVFGSLIAQESGGRAGVRGPDTQYGNALGRTQVLPSTARGIAKNLGIPYREDLLTGTSPEAASYQDQLGRAYLQEGFQNTGNARDALMYYHGGPDRSLWGPKTNAYADEVLARWSQGGGVAPVDGVQTAPQQQTSIQEGATATNPETGEKVTFNGGQWVPSAPQEVEVNAGVLNVNGRAIVDGVDRGPWEDYWTNQRRSQEDRRARIERERTPEYQAAIADARRGSENVPERLRALTQGGALGFLDEIVGGASYIDQALANAGDRVAGRPVQYSASMAAQAARDAERDAQSRFAAENPIENFGLQLAGGLLTPGIGAAGRYVEAGQGAGRLGRAAQVGAGYGAISGAGYGEGNLAQRTPGAALGAVVGAGTGTIGQAGIDRLMRGAGSRAPDAARILSREGVDLTPGQLASGLPIIGNTLRALEEGASSIPFVGSPIAGARQQSVETFNRAAINRALKPIGEKLPKGMNAGYEAVERAQTQLGKAYDDILPQVSARIDDAFDEDLSVISSLAQTDLTPQLAQQYDNILRDRVFRNIPEGEVIDGSAFKRIESEIGSLSREYRTAADPQNRALARVLDDTREVVRDLIARQNPDQASRIRDINRGYANLVKVEDAAASTASQAAEGVFSPTQLGVSARRGATRSQAARGEAMMQDLAVAGRNIIPSRVGDSGTATRGAMTGIVAGLGSGVPVAGALAVPVIATSIAYSRPAQALLNAAYRATDSQQGSVALREFAALARRNPALLPYYEAAAQHVAGLSRTDTPAIQPAQSSAPVPSAALQRVMQ